MNKLTTINTITKAAPLALLAVVMSGSAFAGKNDNPGKGKKGEPQASVSVVTSCSLCGYPSDPNYNPDKYADCNLTNPTLYISAKVIDETGDLEPDAALTYQFDVDAAATRRDKGGRDAWTNVASDDIPEPSGDWWNADFDLCTEDPSIDGAKAISGIVNVVVTGLDASKSVYSSRCENFDPDPSTEEVDDDGIDQSNFDVKELEIVCE